MQRQPNQLRTCSRHKGNRTKEPSSKHKSPKFETNLNWQTVTTFEKMRAAFGEFVKSQGMMEEKIE